MPSSSYAGSQRELWNKITPHGPPRTTNLSVRQFTQRWSPIHDRKFGEQLLSFFTIPSQVERSLLRGSFQPRLGVISRHVKGRRRCSPGAEPGTECSGQ